MNLYDHPRYRDILSEAKQYQNREYNTIPLDVVETYADEYLFEHIRPYSVRRVLENAPDFAEDFVVEYLEYEGELSTRDARELAPELVDRPTEDLLYYLKRETSLQREVEAYGYENYPMWGWVWEASNGNMNRLIDDEEEAIQEIGFGIIDGFGRLNNMLFVAGAGYDFYEAHWIPLFSQVLPWIDIAEEEEAELTLA